MVLMGSGALAAEECVDALLARGEKVGLVNVHLFRPFFAAAFVEALPSTVKAIAVLDRTKEPGSAGEPLYQDVLTALNEAGRTATATGGRRTLRSREQRIHAGHGRFGVFASWRIPSRATIS